MRFLQRIRWAALHGSPGSGKTQLARATAAAPNHVRAWISLGGYDSVQAANCLNLFRTKLLTPSEPIPAGALIVVDDAPASPIGSMLAASIVALHRTGAQLGYRTLCVSEHRILASVAPNILSSATAEFECPPLTDEDILGMLQQREAPTRFLAPQWLAFFAGITHRHMLLFVAMLAHLAECNWQLDEAALATLLGGDFALGLAPAASERLFRSVPDEQTRELLHRVRLATGPITDGALSGLANAPTRVPEPLLRIAPIDGVWLLRDPTRRLVLSPLMRALPPATLLSQKRRVRASSRPCGRTLETGRNLAIRRTARALSSTWSHALASPRRSWLATSLASALSNREMTGARNLASTTWRSTQYRKLLPLMTTGLAYWPCSSLRFVDAASVANSSSRNSHHCLAGAPCLIYAWHPQRGLSSLTSTAFCRCSMRR